MIASEQKKADNAARLTRADWYSERVPGRTQEA